MTIPARYPTKYEVILTDGVTTYLVRYRWRRTGQALREEMRDIGPAIVRMFGIETWKMASKERIDLSPGNWRIQFSGRTQREAIQAEHPFFDRVAEESAA